MDTISYTGGYFPGSKSYRAWKAIPVTGSRMLPATSGIILTGKRIGRSHEFPSYSFVLGDLHAHVVNILFVLLLIGILYAWMKKMKAQRLDQVDLRTFAFWKREMLSPYLLLAGLLLGMYQWTNFWDFVIYFVVTGGVMLFGNIVRLGGRIRKILAVTIVQAF